MSGATGYGEALGALTKALERIGLPVGRVLMLHVRLRGLHEATSLDYADCTRLVLDAVDAFGPRAVLVPAFTYSFAKSGVFHRVHSRAETGRFSEEVRLNHARYRTPDPMFSVLDTKEWLGVQDGMVFDGAFEPGCLWERLLGEDAAIVNVGIGSFVATQIHYLERLRHAPWRLHKRLTGVAYEDEARCARVEYDFFARDLAVPHLLDWPRIEAALDRSGELRRDDAFGVKVSAIGVAALHAVVGARMDEDVYFPVNPAG